MSLPYASLKTLHAKNKSINPFFSDWNALSSLPADITGYRYVVDTIKDTAYYRPNVTTDGLTRMSPSLVDPTGTEIGQRNLATKGATYVHMNTVDGPYLVITKREVAADPTALAATIYKTMTKKATRHVIPSDRQVHWVWFRKTPTYRLTEEIVLRAASWIELNPDYAFHLWTNLADRSELDDFLADLPTELRDRYFPAITVHYACEFRSAVQGWFSEHLPDLLPVFTAVWDSTERQDIVMKTDYTRNILLALYGGMYADFNDCLCLAPMEPFLEANAGSFAGVTDNTLPNNASNYFMYAGVDNAEFLEIVKQCTATLPSVYTAIHGSEHLDAAVSFLRGENAGQKELLQTLAYAVEIAAPSAPVTTALKTASKGGRRADIALRQLLVLKAYAQEILRLMDKPEFGPAWRFSLTDTELRHLMYKTNLPIFCCEQGIPIYMLPFSYLLRYSCLLSFVGHLGDGTSYGQAPTQRSPVRSLYDVR